MPRTLLLLMFSTLATWGSSDQQSWTTIHKSLASSNPDHRRQTLTALGSIGPSNHIAVGLIEESLRNDKDIVVRQTAAAVLGQMQARAAIPALKDALEDKDEVAFSAANAMAEMGDYSGLNVFVDVLSGERKDSPGFVAGKVREAKAKVRHPDQLALMGAKEASGALLGPASMGIVVAQEAFKDGGSSGRALAALALAKDPDPYAVTLLEWALGDNNPAVRAAAAKGLGERGNEGSVARLNPLLSDDHTAVRTMAAAAIIRIEGREGAR
jgi:HEAT repeat protein